MPTKRDLLLTICEAPGWAPPVTPPPSSVETYLRELQDEGWIAPRLDGFEATPQAIEAYPDFPHQEDIVNPEPIPPAMLVNAPSDWGGEKAELISIAPGQRVDAPLPLGDGLKGGVTVQHAGSGRMEIEILVRVRKP